MPIRKDLSELPAGDQREGVLPDAAPRYAPVLARAWENTVEKGELAFAVPGTRFRHSWAGKCARELSYLTLGYEPSEPFDEATYWVFGIGKAIHELWQQRLMDAFPGCEVEVNCRIDEMDSSGHIDAVITGDNSGVGVPAGKKVALELKTINGFGFKMAIGARGKAEGPRDSAIIQGALNAHAVDADELVIVYLALENLSPREAHNKGLKEPWQRFSAEWSWTREQYEPIALAEIARVQQIHKIIDGGNLAPRLIPSLPAGAEIVDPLKGTWIQRDATGNNIAQTGSFWGCAYCSFRSQCVADG